MLEIPNREIVSIGNDGYVRLECGHKLWMGEYGDTHLECIHCVTECRDGIKDLRGRVAIRCQVKVIEDVWIQVGGRFNMMTPVSEIRYQVDSVIGDDELPF